MAASMSTTMSIPTLVASSPTVVARARALLRGSHSPVCSSLSSSSCRKLPFLNSSAECRRGRWNAASNFSPSVVSMASSSPSAGSSTPSSGNSSKTVFVAGATGQTGKRIVNELLSQGYGVRAGVRDVTKAQDILPKNDNLELVLADVTQGADTLSKAIAGSNAVIVATGFRPSIDITTSWKVDNIGTKNVVDACAQKGIKRLVLVSSILVNGAAKGQIFNPIYILLNIFGLTLVAKLQAEKYIRESGIDYTIIRPGGLKNDPPSGNIVLGKEDTLFKGSVSRDSVAKVAVDSLSIPEASFKVVELIATPDAPAKSIPELFSSLS